MSQFRLKKLLGLLVVSGALLALQFVLPATVQAQTTAWSGVCVDTVNPDVATLQGLQCLLANVLGVALQSLGITALVMFIFAMVRRQFSGTNAQGTEKSNQTATAAGFAIVLFLSSFIIMYLLSAFTGITSIMHFKIPDSNTCWPEGTPC